MHFDTFSKSNLRLKNKDTTASTVDHFYLHNMQSPSPLQIIFIKTNWA